MNGRPRLRPFIVSATLVGASCTVPGENAAVVIDEVPYDLLGSVDTTSTTEPEPEGPFTLELYFISEVDESLVRVVRPREQPPGLQESIEALMDGPTEAELELVQMRARLSEALNPVASPPTNGLVAVTVSDDAQFRDSANRLPSQVLVCTLTQFPEVDAVELRDSIGPIPLAGANSESIGGPARRSNYNDCAATDAALPAGGMGDAGATSGDTSSLDDSPVDG